MTHTPRNEFERLSDQDPALGQDQQPAFNQDSLIANLKARLPEATLGEDFPKASEQETQQKLNEGTPYVSPRLDQDRIGGQISKEAASDAPHPNEQASKIQSSKNPARERPFQEEQSTSGVVALTRKPKRIAWGQIAASVAITALVAGSAATAVANSRTGNPTNTEVVAGSESTQVGDSAEMSPYEPTDEGQGATGTESYANPALGGGAGGGDETTSRASGSATDSAAESTAVGDASKFRDTYRNHFSASGFSTQSETAHAYGFDESEVVNKATFKKLMKAFDVDAKLVSEWGTFSASKADKYSLYMSGDGTGSFYYSVYEQPVKQAKNNKDAALEDAKAKMTALGMNLDEFEITAETTEYWTWIDDTVARAYNEDKAAADRILAGEKKLKIVRVSATRNNLTAEDWAGRWSFDYMGKKLLSADGSLAKSVDLGEYKVVSAAEGVERLNDERFGVSNLIYPEGWEDQYAMEEPAVSNPNEKSGPTARPVPQVGRSFEWAVSNVKLTSADLTHAVFGEDDGLFILPVWEFKASNGAKYQVIAVEDTSLDFNP